MTTTVLGANGRLGGMLTRFSSRADLGWKAQHRGTGVGLRWSGRFADEAPDDIFCEGATIINMIGHTGRDAEVLQATNVKFVRALLNHSASCGVAHVILASSAAVYGNGDGTAFHESDPLAPTSPYGASKAAMEEVAHTAPDGPKITILRIGNVAGADALLQAARSQTAIGQPMGLHRFASGRAATRSYIGPLDLARVIVSVAGAARSEAQRTTTLNVAHPSPVRLDDLLASYRTHLLPDLNWKDETAPEGIPEEVVLNVEALQQLHSFSPANADHFAQQVAQDQTP